MPRQHLVAALAAAAALATALPAAAQFQKPEDAVKYRKAAFTVMATHFGRLGAMAQGRIPFDSAVATSNAEIVAFTAKLPYAGFVEGTSGTGKGDPKASIWTERAKFDGLASKLSDESNKLVAAAKSNNLDRLQGRLRHHRRHLQELPRRLPQSVKQRRACCPPLDWLTARFVRAVVFSGRREPQDDPPGHG